MHGLLQILQNGLDQTDNDIRLYFKQRISFPKKYRAIEIEFPDGKFRHTVRELDEISTSLLKNFELSKEYEQALEILYLYTADSKNIASDLGISYALTDCCGPHRGPGVIIYWDW